MAPWLSYLSSIQLDHDRRQHSRSNPRASAFPQREMSVRRKAHDAVVVRLIERGSPSPKTSHRMGVVRSRREDRSRLISDNQGQHNVPGLASIFGE